MTALAVVYQFGLELDLLSNTPNQIAQYENKQRQDGN